jgi:hypothetical protein
VFGVRSMEKPDHFSPAIRRIHFGFDSRHLFNVSQAGCPLIRQCKRHNFVRRFTPKIASPSCSNHYELFATFLS